MKALKNRLERIFRWIDIYGWVIPAFLLGVTTGLLVVVVDVNRQDFTLAVITAIGTVGAAIAALWTTQLSRQTLDRQLSHEEELKKPNLVLSGISVEELSYQYEERYGQYKGHFGFHVELTNLGQFPIYIKHLTSSIAGETSIFSGNVDLALVNHEAEDEPEWRGILMPPNESIRRIIGCNFPIPIEGEPPTKGLVTISFQHGPTARKMHNLNLKVTIISYDMDHSFDGNMRIENDGETYLKNLHIGYNHNRLPRDEDGRVIRNS